VTLAVAWVYAPAVEVAVTTQSPTPERETVGTLLSGIEQLLELSEYVIAAPPRAVAAASNVNDETLPPSQSRNVLVGDQVIVCCALGVAVISADAPPYML
jgi:hypothetical protein